MDPKQLGFFNQESARPRLNLISGHLDNAARVRKPFELQNRRRRHRAIELL
jgi:hypothetical protein